MNEIYLKKTCQKRINCYKVLNLVSFVLFVTAFFVFLRKETKARLDRKHDLSK